MMRVGVTGGIGSGKSTVCRLFEERGVAVFDSDAVAKQLMAGVLCNRIAARFGAAAYPDGMLDRKYLANIVFNDSEALADLNAIVHPAVIEEFDAWCDRQSGGYVLLESAILFAAGFAAVVDKTLVVMAPAEVRVERTCRRDGVVAEEVRRRMAAQWSDDELAAKADYTMVNLFEEDMDAAVAELDRKFKRDAKAY